MTPTREQVIDMSIASGLNDRLRLDSEASRILSVQCLERFATLAMSAGRDQGLREAKEVCEADGFVEQFRGLNEAARRIKQLRAK